MRRSTILLVLVVLATGGCAGRQAIEPLNREQTEYFAKLQEKLREQRSALAESLRKQAEIDARLQRDILDWELGQVRADILLRAGSTAGSERLLLAKMAEVDRSARAGHARVAALHRERVETILRLYDAVTEAAAKLGTNGKAINEYLASPGAAYALQSLDVPALVGLVSSVEQIRDEMKGVEAASADEQQERRKKLESQLNDARATLQDVLGS